MASDMILKTHFFPFLSSATHSALKHRDKKTQEIVSQSAQFSHSAVSNSLRPHGPQHARLACPSPTPRAYSNSCPLSPWRHPTISSSVIPFSFAFNLSQHQGLFQWASSSHEVAKVLELQHQSFQWFPLGLTGLISLLSKGCSRVFSTQLKGSILRHLAFFTVQLSHLYMTTGKTIALTRWTSVSKVMSLLFHMLSRFVIAFLPRSKCLLISWLQSPSAVILEHRVWGQKRYKKKSKKGNRCKIMVLGSETMREM